MKMTWNGRNTSISPLRRGGGRENSTEDIQTMQQQQRRSASEEEQHFQLNKENETKPEVVLESISEEPNMTSLPKPLTVRVF
jgi:hypothetical protein